MQTVTVSTKGQIVIPQQMRESMHVQPGDSFVILNEDDTLILKKLGLPSKKELLAELHALTLEATKRLKDDHLTEDAVIAIAMRKK